VANDFIFIQLPQRCSKRFYFYSIATSLPNDCCGKRIKIKSFATRWSFMPRRSYPSPSLSAAVRAHLGLTQAELARFVGVSRQLIASEEAGTRFLHGAPRHRLWVLARLLPPPDGHGPPAPAFALGTDADDSAPAPDLPGLLDEAPLRARLRRCRFYIIKARYELGQRQRPAESHARRRWAVGVLQAAWQAPVAPPLSYPLATPDPVADPRWLVRFAADTAAAPPPLTPAGRALRLARLRGLEAEAATLEAQLAAGQ
jgi:transcriptional regulator with XRE-family HTH domain